MVVLKSRMASRRRSVETTLMFSDDEDGDEELPGDVDVDGSEDEDEDSANDAESESESVVNHGFQEEQDGNEETGAEEEEEEEEEDGDKDDGDVDFPFQIPNENLEVLTFGDLRTKNRFYHTKDFLLPTGFVAIKTWFSYKNPSATTKYTCVIEDGGKRPLFVITANDAQVCAR